MFCHVQVLECMYVRQATDLLEGLIPGGEEGRDMSVTVLERIIVFAIMWSLGALLELDDRKKVTCSFLFSNESGLGSNAFRCVLPKTSAKVGQRQRALLGDLRSLRVSLRSLKWQEARKSCNRGLPFSLIPGNCLQFAIKFLSV